MAQRRYRIELRIARASGRRSGACAHSQASTILPLNERSILKVRKFSVPDSERALVFKSLGIDWKRACPVQNRTAMKINFV